MRKYEKGYALVLSIILIDVLVVMTFFMANKISREAHNTTREESTIRAQYYAEAALEYAAANISNEDIWSPAASINNKYTMKNNKKKNLVDNFLSPGGASIGNIKREIDGSDVTIIIENLEYRNRVKNLEVTFEKVSGGLGGGIFDNQMNAGNIVNVNSGDVIEFDPDSKVYHVGNLTDNFNKINWHEKGSTADPEYKQILKMLELYNNVKNYIDSSGDPKKFVPSEFLDWAGNIVKNHNNAVYNDLFIPAGEIWDFRGMNFNSCKFNIKGDGIIIMDGSTNFNGETQLNINYDADPFHPNGGEFDKDHSLTILRNGGFPSLKVNIRGMIYATDHFNNNDLLNIEGSVITQGSLMTGGNKIMTKHDNSFLEGLSETLVSNGITVPEDLFIGENDDASTIGHTIKRWREY